MTIAENIYEQLVKLLFHNYIADQHNSNKNRYFYVPI